jgi:hypothetical protein
VFVKLSNTTCSSPEDLVDYWEQFYEENTQHPDSKFLEHLKWKGGKLTADDVRYLFAWKYRPVPSWDPRPVIKRLHELNELRFKQGRSVVEFAETFSKEGLVKRFLICHIISPRKYPVWDQYVLKAHLLISGRSDEIARAGELIHDEREYESYRIDFNSWVRQVPSRVWNSIEYPPFLLHSK